MRPSVELRTELNRRLKKWKLENERRRKMADIASHDWGETLVSKVESE
jgi:hypothetical protein